MANEVYVDEEHGVVYLNQTSASMGSVFSAMRQHPELAALESWSRQSRSPVDSSRGGSLFERDRYVTPDNVFDQMRVAYKAQDDDVVGAWLDTTESLAFSRMVIESAEPDEADVLNQIADDIGLLSRMKEIWREDNIVSNVYVATWWGPKTYKCEGKTDSGNAKRKQFPNIVVPRAMSVLDPLRIVPLGSHLFGMETLCYAANWAEQDAIDTYLNRDIRLPAEEDRVIAQLIRGKYTPTLEDRRNLANLGVDANRLYELNPRTVFRHTATRSSYQQFANVRLKSIMELLDLKHQLRQMDRAHLVGGTNFIVVIKKGSDALPGQPEEIAQLQSQVRVLSQVPVIVGDQRLTIEIVTPNTDHTLDSARYAGLDNRIQANLYGMFVSPGTKGGDDSLKLARVIARGLEARREAQRDTVVDKVVREIRRRNPERFSEKPEMRYFPRRIALDFDPGLYQFILDLLNNGKLSLESGLGEVDFDVYEEARRKEREKKAGIEKTMMPVLPPPGSPGAEATTPPGAPGKTDPKAGGRAGGGRRAGGGAAPGSGQGKTSPTGRPKKAKTGTERPSRQAAEDEGDET